MIPQGAARPATSNQGFTLLELSVVLAIIALIMGASLTTLVGAVQTAAFNNTVARMDAIEKALLNYAVANGRIPCPSDLTLKPSDANYGVEAANKGSCWGGTPAGNFKAASGTVEGGIPTRALMLPDAYMYDAWNRRFRYAVDPAMTAANSLPVAAACSLTPTPSSTAITVSDATGAARTTMGIYAIVSHGADGHGAYTSNGTVFSAGSTNTDEQTNCHCNSSGASTTYAPTYVQKLPTKNPAIATDQFDDLVTYKEGWQIQAQNFQLKACGLGCSPSKYLYVADGGNSRIQKFDMNGTYVTSFATGATCIAIDNKGYLWVSNGSQVQKLDTNGNVLGNFGSGYNPWCVTIDSSGNFRTTDFGGGYVNLFDKNGGFVRQITGVSPNPQAITADNNGNIWIGDESSGSTKKYDKNGNFVQTIPVGTVPGDTGLSNLDESGNIWIADYSSGKVYKLDSSGNLLMSAFGGGILNGPNGIAVDSSGNIWVGEWNGGNLIHKFDKNGTQLSQFGGPGSGPSQFAGMQGLAFGCQ